MTAQEIQKHIKAGLTLCGKEDGDLQWVGTRQAWDKLEELLNE